MMLKEKLDGRKDLQTMLFRGAWLVSKDYLPADLHYNEVTWGCWGRSNISDEHHLDIKMYLNKELYDMGIRVVNMKETATRARLLNIIETSFLTSL